LGIEVDQSKERVVIFETKYALDILNEIGMIDFKLVDCLVEINARIGRILL